MHIRHTSTHILSQLTILGCILSSLMLTGCGGGADDPATITALKDLGVLVVPNVDGQVSSLNGLPGDAAKLTEAIELTKKLNSLKTITIMEGIPLSDEHMSVIGQNRNLIELNVNGAPLTDVGVSAISGCKRLESLSLIASQVTSDSMPTFAKLTKLNMLNINDTKIDGGYASLQKCKNLQWILIGGLNVSDEEAVAISQIPGITHVTLSDTTKLSDAGMASLKSVKDCTVDLVANQPAAAP